MRCDMRRSPQVAELLPLLYFRGLSTDDIREALPVLLGKDAAGLSATNIARLTVRLAHRAPALEERYRESTESRSSALRDLSRGGLRAPVMATADRAPAFCALSDGAGGPEGGCPICPITPDCNRHCLRVPS